MWYSLGPSKLRGHSFWPWMRVVDSSLAEALRATVENDGVFLAPSLTNVHKKTGSSKASRLSKRSVIQGLARFLQAGLFLFLTRHGVDMLWHSLCRQHA